MQQKPTPLFSAIPIASLIVLLFIGLDIFGTDALNGASQICLLIATGICLTISILKYKATWNDHEKALKKNIADTSVSIFILLLIGAMSGTWMVSGIVPTLIYYGLQIISPQIFLFTACIISGLVSIVTGSSWTTIATIGIALLGIGRAEGFSDGWIAGAIISGAYFGDKISPLSDTTVLASSVSGTKLFDHIKYMLNTTVPAIAITLIIFFIAGFFMGESSAQDFTGYLSALDETFNISIFTMIVPVITGILIYKKAPALIVLFVSTLAASISALILQPQIIAEIGGGNGASEMFKGVFTAISDKTNIKINNELLSELVSTSGMSGMLNTIWLILCAVCFGAAMNQSGMLQCFITAIFRKIMKTRVGLVFSTISNALMMNVATGDQYISIILTANMFKDEYKKQGYENRLLSRTCEDSATVTSVLVPWNTCGMTQSTVLGVATLVYLPYCFFNLLSPLMSLIHAIFGWKIHQKSPEEISAEEVETGTEK